MARVDQLIVTYFALIQPAEYWTHWDLNAQAIHRIGRDEGRVRQDGVISVQC